MDDTQELLAAIQAMFDKQNKRMDEKLDAHFEEQSRHIKVLFKEQDKRSIRFWNMFSMRLIR